MKIGSLVECISDSFFAKEIPIAGLSTPKVKSIYEVREVVSCTCGKCGSHYLLLQEIVNPKIPIFAGNNLIIVEPPFEIENFREVEFNEDEIKEVIKEGEPICL